MNVMTHLFFHSMVMESYVVFLPLNYSDAFSNGIIIYNKLNGQTNFISAGDEKKAEEYCICYKKRMI